MAYVSWETIDGCDGEDGHREIAYYGDLAMVVTRRENHYEWSLRVDDKDGAELRSGATKPHASFDRRDGSRDEACKAVHAAAQSLVSDVEECASSELESIKRAVPSIRSQAFTRGAEHGARGAAESLRKRARNMRAAADALDKAASSIVEDADVIAHKCRDPYEGQS